jgi:hypothetical protein
MNQDLKRHFPRPLTAPGWSLVASIAALVGGCAAYGPEGLPAGSSRADVVKAMGAPTSESPLAGGGQRLEYARGPLGRHTYMLDFDAQGRMQQANQVLTEARFDAIQVGMPQAQVLASLGRPSERMNLAWQQQTVWMYRYDAIFCRWFQVGIDTEGRVASTGYGPDPLCEANDASDRL